MRLCVVASVGAELSLLKAQLDAQPDTRLCGYRPYRASCPGVLIWICEIGIGVTAAALALGALVTRIQPDRVIMVGSAGALPGSGLQVGDVVSATSETFAELGICRGFEMGAADALTLPSLHQEISLDGEFARTLAPDVGRFLTVAGVSGDEAVAVARADRFGTAAENMEGYALAVACRRFGIPGAEVRGISNQAGIREKSAWNLELANERAQRCVIEYLRVSCL